MRAWRINGVEKRGKFEKRKMRGTKAEEKGDRIREREREREMEAGLKQNLIYCLSASMQFMGSCKKIFTQFLRHPPNHTAFPPLIFVCDREPCANFKFMHGKFAHAVKINDAAARKCRAQLVEAFNLLLACLFVPSFWPTLAIDNSGTKTPAAGCQIWAFALKRALNQKCSAPVN